MNSEARWLSIGAVLITLIICGSCAGTEMYRKKIMADMVKGGADPTEVACALGMSGGSTMAEAGNACIVAASHRAAREPREGEKP